MIRHIVAIDSQRGMAKDGGMPPWKMKQDEAYFTQKTLSDGATVLMGRRTFIEALKNVPLKDRTNYIVTRDPTPIPGTIVVNDLAAFMSGWPDDHALWIIGGAEIFSQTLGVADELYITEIDANYECDTFYPAYLESFEPAQTGKWQVENQNRFRFMVYRRKSHQ